MALDPSSWSEHTLRVLTALGTAGAVVALVVIETLKGTRRTWREYRGRPRLSLTHDPQVDLAREAVAIGQVAPIRAAYVRLGVVNAAGRRAAPAVEVVVRRVEQIDRPPDEPSDDRLPTYNMGPLGWTHRDPLLNQLGPGVSRTVDLGALPVGSSHFQVGLGVPPPLSGVNLLGPGTYRFTLTVSAANADARDWSVELWHDGSLEAPGTFSEHVRITRGPEPA